MDLFPEFTFFFNAGRKFILFMHNPVQTPDKVNQAEKQLSEREKQSGN